MRSLFFLSASFFALQVLLAPTLAGQFVGRELIVILSPPYIIMALVLTLGFLRPAPRREFLTFPQLVAFCAFLVFGSLAIMKFLMEKMIRDETNVLGKFFLSQQDSYIPLFIVLLCVPHVGYALVLLRLMKAEGARLVTIFKVEMLGAGSGIIAAGWLIDQGSWGVVVGFIFAALAAAYVVAGQERSKGAMVTAVVLLGLLVCSPWLEPQTDLRWSARWGLGSPSKTSTVRELEKSWNSYSKIQKLEIETERGSRRIISLGNGAGTAQLTYNPGEPPPYTVRLVQGLAPRNALILFCGPGIEILALRDHGVGVEKITGVELNPQLIAMSLDDEKLQLKQALTDPRLALIESDARAYLERSGQRFDLILFSWSGATSSYYAGVSAHTAKFAFTREALRTAWERLTDEGTLVFFGVSKVNVLATLKAALPEITDLSSRVVLLERKGRTKWESGWDNHVLYVKKTPLTEANLAGILRFTENTPFLSAVEPTATKAGYEFFRELLTTANVPQTLARINQSTALNFRVITDDRPFPYDVAEKQPSAMSIERYVLFSAVVAGLLLVAMYLRTKTRSVRDTLALLQFSCLGVSGVLWQLYAIYLNLILVGNPTWALVFGMGVSLLAHFLGAQLVGKFEVSKRAVMVLAGLGVVSWCGIFYVTAYQAKWFFRMGGTGYALLACWILVSSVLTSTLFPWLLQQHRSSEPQRWFVVDAVMAAFTCGAAPLLIERYGFWRLQSVAALCLVLVVVSLFVPTVSRERDRLAG